MLESLYTLVFHILKPYKCTMILTWLHEVFQAKIFNLEKNHTQSIKHPRWEVLDQNGQLFLAICMEQMYSKYLSKKIHKNCLVS